MLGENRASIGQKRLAWKACNLCCDLMCHPECLTFTGDLTTQAHLQTLIGIHTPSSQHEIKGVTHAYETAAGPLPVLDNLKVSVNEGGFVAVVGPSGCGKSTLTRLVAGLMKPDTGEVWLHGERVKSHRETAALKSLPDT